MPEYFLLLFRQKISIFFLASSYHRDTGIMQEDREMRNIEVAKAWARGEKAESGNMTSDGIRIWSYAMLIGEVINGERVVYRRRRSVTTTKHVNLAARYADKVIDPE